ncbi:MAG TPA: histidine phosphatase family protein, partial [Gaiellaceae bacterium]|nr:histidine phosphatase family protein [Gaiellaceae bacterium]
MTTIVLARHGETDWNREQRFQGHADRPLNELGREQARELAERLRNDRIDAVYSSPLVRALETAETVAAALGLPVETREALREVDVGSWEGLSRDEIEERHPEDFARWV